MKLSEKFLFSVVMPIYNTEEYLRDALDSLINQTIGFERNIQVILVNDGSTDASEQLCLQYQSRFPDNIEYIYKENGGISAARNDGMQYIQGRYVNFMDSDDKWDANAFAEIRRFMEAHDTEVDFVSCRHYFFEGESGFHHPLDYKFKKELVVNTLENYTYIQIAVNALCFTARAIQNLYFNEEVFCSEDSLFVSESLLRNSKYGILPTAIYYYRKRENLSSVVNTKESNLDWYYKVPHDVYERIMELSIEKYGEVTPYFQAHILYELIHRIRNKKVIDILTDAQMTEYIATIRSLLERIDDEIISSFPNLSFGYELFVLNLKYGRNILEFAAIEDACFVVNGTKTLNLQRKTRLNLDILRIEKGRLILDGRAVVAILDEYYRFAIIDEANKEYPIDNVIYDRNLNYGFTGILAEKISEFHAELPLAAGKKYRFVLINLKTKEIVSLYPYPHRFSKLTDKVKHSYYSKDGYIVRRTRTELCVSIASRRNLLKRETKYLLEMLKKRLFREIIGRLKLHLAKANKKKDIWIITDRSNAAGDNGEAFFKYLNNRPDVLRTTDVYFAIQKSSPDYSRLARIGKVIDIESRKFLKLYLLSDRVISSHFSPWIVNPAPEKSYYVRDFREFDYTFLQHGVTKDDLSKTLRRVSLNLAHFVTSARAEYKSIIEGDYGYSCDEVILTGFPRFDFLEDRREKKIVFLPTWRLSLAGNLDELGQREFNDEFKHSEYCKFYNRLINDEKLINCMEEHGYTGEFYTHPAHEAQKEDFVGNAVIRAMETDADYSEVFSKSALLVTDYSSTAMDFAYLKKPVIYTQFDADTFYEGHTYQKGYYEYERDGFGPVCTDYESALRTIIEYIRNDCQMEQKYRDRVNTFFAFTDKNNCERVFRAITARDKKNEDDGARK